MKIDSEPDGSDFRNFNGEEREYTWRVNLELDRHSNKREMMVEEALEAVKQTASGYFVNLVTHAEHRHPSGYLYSALDEEFGDNVEY